MDALIKLARTRPPAEAIPLLQDFLHRHPRVLVARQLLARALVLGGRHDEAHAEVLQLVELAPHDPGFAITLSEIDILRGEPEAALRTLRALPQRGPWVLAAEAAALRAAGRCGEAIQLLDPVLTAEPQLGSARIVRGACRMELGQLGGAQDDLTKVLASNEKDPDVRFLLGDLALRRGDPGAAIGHLQEHLKQRPDAGLTLLALGMAKVRTGARDEGLADLRRAASSPDTRAAGPLTLADVLLADPATSAEVEELLEEAERREPASNKILEVRAAWHLSQGRTQQALDTMVQAGRRDGG